MPVVHVRANEVLEAIGIHRNRFLAAAIPKRLSRRDSVAGSHPPRSASGDGKSAGQQKQQRTCASRHSYPNEAKERGSTEGEVRRFQGAANVHHRGEHKPDAKTGTRARARARAVPVDSFSGILFFDGGGGERTCA